MSRLATSFNFLASLLSQGDWFETCFVGNLEDRITRVETSYISVVCSTALEQILQVQCLLLLPLWESVIVLCFVVRCFVSVLELQSS